MIYTVTLNPALDYAARVESFCDGATNRATEIWVTPGGKGINVAAVLHNLKIPVRALGFAAGFTGRAILELLREAGVPTDMIEIPGLCRLNVKIKSETETEINAPGAEIPPEALEQLFSKIREIPAGSYLVLGGSVPPSVSSDIYERLLGAVQDRKIRCTVDATKELLTKTLKYRPYLVKPNRDEIAEIFGVKLRKTEEVFTYARKLRDMGARNVIVSLADEGALMVSEGGAEFFTAPPKGTAVDSVGAGDSLVAGFLAAKSRGEDDRRAFLYGVAAGSATAFKRGLATESEVMALLPQLGE